MISGTPITVEMVMTGVALWLIILLGGRVVVGLLWEWKWPRKLWAWLTTFPEKKPSSK